ncbi:hypothetical protein SAMN06272775_0891 [Streptomyces sp. 2323.1]|nr:hypothetical protein SAMN06272775_0891 [Streptomyces sp. 2323.1]
MRCTRGRREDGAGRGLRRPTQAPGGGTVRRDAGTRRSHRPPGPPPSLYSSGFCESIPGRAFFHCPRVKSGISCGAPFALIERSLSGTGAVQVAAS